MSLKQKIYFLGTPVAEYNLPLSFINDLNNLIDERLKINTFESMSKSLAGQIEKEYSILNYLTYPMINVFRECIQKYLLRLNIKFKNFEFSQCWFNEQKEHEYNPIHTHRSKLNTGISSVLFLKVPKGIYEAKEKNQNEQPTDGRLQFVTGNECFIDNTSMLIHPEIGNFYLFPYSLKHCVYPFKGDGIRRSLSFNVDVFI